MSANNIMKLSNPVWKRLRKVKLERDITYNELVTRLIDLLEDLEKQAPLYGFGDKLFADLADARGEQILFAVRKKKNQPIKILYPMGEDSGK